MGPKGGGARGVANLLYGLGALDPGIMLCQNLKLQSRPVVLHTASAGGSAKENKCPSGWSVVTGRGLDGNLHQGIEHAGLKLLLCIQNHKNAPEASKASPAFSV